MQQGGLWLLNVMWQPTCHDSQLWGAVQASDLQVCQECPHMHHPFSAWLPRYVPAPRSVWALCCQARRHLAECCCEEKDLVLGRPCHDCACAHWDQIARQLAPLPLETRLTAVRQAMPGPVQQQRQRAQPRLPAQLDALTPMPAGMLNQGQLRPATSRGVGQKPADMWMESKGANKGEDMDVLWS